MIDSQTLLKKHQIVLEAARKYWVTCEPTGLSDAEFDRLEENARQDGIEVRDVVMSELQGTRFQNASFLTKIPKVKLKGELKDINSAPNEIYFVPKYDGSSLVAYYDVNTGKVMRVVTVGGSNLNGMGIDQTYKLAKYFPSLPGTGIMALQAEALIQLEKGYGQSSRQKANGLINSKYLDDGVDRDLTIRAFRYFLAPGNYESIPDYRDVIQSLPKVYNSFGDLKFSGAMVLDRSQLLKMPSKDEWITDSGSFMIDGVVAYDQFGICQQAYKFYFSGSGEATEVLEIKWNDNSKEGKDSWSANAIINPVDLRGSKITKPKVPSLTKMVEVGLSKGSKVSVILAGSTIPQIDQVFTAGNGDFQWPTCGCGYKMSELDIVANRLRCHNAACTDRIIRIESQLRSGKVDLNKLLPIDRLKWEEAIDRKDQWNFILKIYESDLCGDYDGDLISLGSRLMSFVKTDAQRVHMKLYVIPLYVSMLRVFGNKKGGEKSPAKI